MSEYVPVPAEALEKTLDIISELRERNARLVAALTKLPDSCCAQTGCGCRKVAMGYIKAALADQQSTEKP